MQYDGVILWAANNIMLLLTIVLVLICAVIDYKALPLIVARYTKPAGGNLSQALNFGRFTISLLVGIYTWIALIFSAFGLKTAAQGLIIWLLVDASFSVWSIFRKSK